VFILLDSIYGFVHWFLDLLFLSTQAFLFNMMSISSSHVMIIIYDFSFQYYYE